MPHRVPWGEIARLVGRWALILLICLLPAGSNIKPFDPDEAYRQYTRPWEFDFVGWTLQAFGAKLGNWSLGSGKYFTGDNRQALVLDYLGLVDQARRLEGELAAILGDPALQDPVAAAAGVSEELRTVRERQDELQTLVETILAEQTSVILAELGLDIGGTAFPPVTFHFTRVPVALIISPREVIRQDANVSLDPGLRFEQQIELETRVEAEMDVSALVVPVGGVGTYPTMIQDTTALAWLIDTIVHEWVHNYLTLHPLGMRYNASPELRTMNETAASILGKEIGRMVLQRYYPDHVPPEEPPAMAEPEEQPAEALEPPAFDFRTEMHETRVTVDAMLLEGRIVEAEDYMEARRRIFWEHGHQIRRLNQAYFAFYGAYADLPGGAAGEDPVGAAVRELWRKTGSPAIFLRAMASMDEFADLQAVLTSPEATR